MPISISGDPTWPGPLVHTIRDVGNVTHALVTAQVGAIVGVRGLTALAGGWVRARGGDVVLAAGGIGLAPLRPALWEIADRRDDFGRVVLLYGARSPSDVLFAHDLERWAGEFGMTWRSPWTTDPSDVGRPGRSGDQTAEPGGFRPAADHGLALRAGDHDDAQCQRPARPRRAGRPVAVVDGTQHEMRRGPVRHCQLRELFICVDGPVLDYERLAPLLDVWEL